MHNIEAQLKELARLQEALKNLRELKEAHCSKDNWKPDLYFRGQATGLAMALLLFDTEREN